MLRLPFAVLLAALGQLSVANNPSSQRVTVASAVTPEAGSPGQSVTLAVEITPKEHVRLFAPGASQFTAVALSVTPPSGYSIGHPEYPVPERQTVPGSKKRVPVYDSKFEVRLPVTISKKARPGDTLRIPAVLIYQTCDERVTYRRSSMPLTFTVRIQ